MPENKTNENNAPISDPIQAQRSSGPPAASPDQTRMYPASEAANAPASIPEMDIAPVLVASPAPEVKPLIARSRPTFKPKAQANYAWIAVPIVLLLVVLAFIITRPKIKTGEAIPASKTQESDSDLSNYSAFVEKNKALIEKASEQLLTGEAFSGSVPQAVGASGPLVSSDVDPQLAALVDALRIRVQVMQGTQSQVRDKATIRVTKGDFRGFKVQAVEKIENNRIVSEEATVITPSNGVIKTVGRVLAALQRTDHAGIMSDVLAAGMEFSSLPVSADDKNFHGRLILAKFWGKPIPGDRLISGESVGQVTLGMPLALLKGRLAATDSILKRKVLINDIYHDVYKVSDQGGNPLFFVYEKQGKVLGIWVVSESFKTDKGIGINSSLDQIRIHYPVVSLSRSVEKTPFVKVAGVNGILIIQDTAGKKVVAILIGDSPEFN